MQILDLPKSKLRLDTDELVKGGAGDSVVARYPTEHIVRIRLEKTQEYGTALVLIAIFMALAFVSNHAGAEKTGPLVQYDLISTGEQVGKFQNLRTRTNHRHVALQDVP